MRKELVDLGSDGVRLFRHLHRDPSGQRIKSSKDLMDDRSQRRGL